MQRVAKFHKVSYAQFEKDWIDTFGQSDNVKDIYRLGGIRFLCSRQDRTQTQRDRQDPHRNKSGDT